MTQYNCLSGLVMKGATKARARGAIGELDDFISELQSQKETLEEGLEAWEEGEDRDDRTDGKDMVEQAAIDTDSLITEVGKAVGMKPYEEGELGE